MKFFETDILVKLKNLITVPLVFSIVFWQIPVLSQAQTVTPQTQENCVQLKTQLYEQLKHYQQTLDEARSELEKMGRQTTVSKKAKVVSLISTGSSALGTVLVAWLATLPPTAGAVMGISTVVGVSAIGGILVATIGILVAAVAGVIYFINKNSSFDIENLKTLIDSVDSKVVNVLNVIQELDKTPVCQN